MVEQSTRRGIALMVAVTFIFAIQDGISRHLAETYNVYMALMVRFWFFAAFVLAIAARSPGGIKRATRSGLPWAQVFRSVVLITEVIVMVQAFVYLGLVHSHAVFACYPLLVAGLSGPVLGEKVGWRRLAAIGVGFIGVLIILKPGFGVFSPYALIPLAAATLFALYSLMTRYVGRVDPASVSFFYTGVIGAVVITVVGIWHWENMIPSDWAWMIVLCFTAATGHFLLIKAYEVAEASAIQPFAYLQLVFASTLGVVVFGEALEWNVVIGAGVVVSAGLFTLWRARVAQEA
ncbi:EamA family transporter [Thioclava sp. F1Mire-8]|uniref:DMT family transporter n=1 Tax=Thioclava sp. F1Mire-8 TaxID=1973006 RepID=UPI000B53C267|nr:DMT family transporter [Thioclava sp. F1Mire-8]OWY01236.1 EamA family transporter [Thioclava sp. F1Mire-8]